METSVITRLKMLRWKRGSRMKIYPRCTVKQQYLQYLAHHSHVFAPEMYKNLNTTLKETFQKYPKSVSIYFESVLEKFHQLKKLNCTYFINHQKEQIEMVVHNSDYSKYSHFTLKTLYDMHLLHAPPKKMNTEKVEVVQNDVHMFKSFCKKTQQTVRKWMRYWVIVLKNCFPKTMCHVSMTREFYGTCKQNKVKWGDNPHRHKQIIVQLKHLPNEFEERAKKIYFVLRSDIDLEINMALVSDCIFGICMTKSFKHISRMPLVSLKTFTHEANLEDTLLKYPWLRKQDTMWRIHLNGIRYHDIIYACRSVDE